MRLTRIAAIFAATILCGCATFQPREAPASKAGFTWSADGALIAIPKNTRQLANPRFGIRYGQPSASILLVDCANATPCTSSGPMNTGTGDPAYAAFGKFNTDFGVIENMFGATGLLVGNGDIPNALSALAPASTGTYCLDWATSINVAPTLVSCPSGMTWPTGSAGIMAYNGDSGYGATYNPSNPIPLDFLADSSLTLGSTSISLGSTVTTITGLTSLTSTTFVGALTGNASTASALGGSPASGDCWGYNGTEQLWVSCGSGSSYITAVDSNFAVTSATLGFASQPTGTVCGNQTGSTGEPSCDTTVSGTGSIAATTSAALITPSINGTTIPSGTPPLYNGGPGGTAYTNLNYPTAETLVCATINGQLLNFGVSGDMPTAAETWTLPAVTTSGCGVGFAFDVYNPSTYTLTISSTTDINGSTTISIPANTGVTITADAGGALYDIVSCTACVTGGTGSGTVNSGTAGQLTYYGSTGTAVSGTADATISGAVLTLGVTDTEGEIKLYSSAGGYVLLTNSAGSGTPSINFPNASGTLGILDDPQTWTAAQTFTAGVIANAIASGGTTFTLGTSTGACATSTALTGGASAGSFECTGTTGSSSITLDLPTATHGWSCWAHDITTGANTLEEGANSTTTDTFSGTVDADDVIRFGCVGY